MPSVGMRRTTRVFGVVKGADSARVLRSGRRLWPESGEGKIRRGNDGDEWLKLVKTTGKGDGWPRGVFKPKQEVTVIGRQKNVGMKRTKPIKESGSLREGNGPNRMCRFVYSRKRKTRIAESSDFSVDTRAKQSLEDSKRWGLFFSRRQRRRCGEVSVRSNRDLLAAVVKPSCGNSNWLSCFLVLVLRYVRRVGLTLKELKAFVLAEPIHGAYALRGIQFLQVNCFLDLCLVMCFKIHPFHCNYANLAFWVSQMHVLVYTVMNLVNGWTM